MKKLIIFRYVLIIFATILISLTGCSSAKTFNKVEYDKFKAITQDVNPQDSTEVRLAQHLYVAYRERTKTRKKWLNSQAGGN
tara:strand:- start:11 stop:256 length:246 start_codon:yes stop_codon:yes gene_type:complete